MIKNLEQIRAKNALSANIGGGAGDGDAVAKKVPTMIRENGFLGAMAFAKEKGVGYADVFRACPKRGLSMYFSEHQPQYFGMKTENYA